MDIRSFFATPKAVKPPADSDQVRLPPSQCKMPRSALAAASAAALD